MRRAAFAQRSALAIFPTMKHAGFAMRLKKAWCKALTAGGGSLLEVNEMRREPMRQTKHARLSAEPGSLLLESRPDPLCQVFLISFHPEPSSVAA
jgi:hypothetical protein